MTLFDSACASLPNRQSDKWWCRPRREEAGDGEREASRRCFSRRESKVALRTQAWLWSSCMLDGLNRNCQCKSVEPIRAGYITPIHNVYIVFRAVPHMWVVNFFPLLVYYTKGHPGRCCVIPAHSHLIFEVHTSHKINEGNKAFRAYFVMCWFDKVFLLPLTESRPLPPAHDLK